MRQASSCSTCVVALPGKTLSRFCDECIGSSFLELTCTCLSLFQSACSKISPEVSNLSELCVSLGVSRSSPQFGYKIRWCVPGQIRYTSGREKYHGNWNLPHKVRGWREEEIALVSSAG